MMTRIKHLFVSMLMLLRPLGGWIVRHIHEERLTMLLIFLTRSKAAALPPPKALAFLFRVERRLYGVTESEALRYGNGIHPKHWLTDYHAFFIQNIPPGSQVLDVGCGIGIVAHDIALRVPDVRVCGIDIAAESIAQANRRFSAENLEFMHGDALTVLPDRTFDVIVLSNVLEHLKKRVDFLRSLQHRYHPHKLLIRVPLFERDWRIALQDELGIDYRSDPTHYIEHRQKELCDEIAEAGLSITAFHVKWGEIWTEVTAHAS